MALDENARWDLGPAVAYAPAPQQTVPPRTTFERYELKYFVSEPEVARILAFAAPYLVRDPHVLSKDAQRNTSLYLDSVGMTFFKQHVQLAPDRSKLRVRVYGVPLGGVAFFEVKRKIKSVTRKERFSLPVHEVPNLLGRRLVKDGAMMAADRRCLENFVYRMSIHRATPKIYVACDREAFQSRDLLEDVRLTVDRDIRYQPATGFAFAPNPRAWRPLRYEDDRRAFGRNKALLELKFDGRAPAWIAQLIALFGLKREAFSKYTTTVSSLRGVAT